MQTVLGVQKRFVEKSCQYRIFNSPAYDHTHCHFALISTSPQTEIQGKIEDPAVYGNFPEFSKLIQREFVREAAKKLLKFTDAESQRVVETIPDEWLTDPSTRSRLAEFVTGRALYVADSIGIDRFSLSDSSESMNRIATWELWGQQNSSPRRVILVAVYAPEPDPKSKHGDFRTLVEMDGVSKSRYVYGVNSMQSLVLAMQLLKIHVEQAVAVGWQFYFDENDDEPFDLIHSLSSHSPSSEH